MEAIRNVTDREGAILLRLAKEGVHPTRIEALMRDELYPNMDDLPREAYDPDNARDEGWR